MCKYQVIGIFENNTILTCLEIQKEPKVHQLYEPEYSGAHNRHSYIDVPWN